MFVFQKGYMSTGSNVCLAQPYPWPLDVTRVLWSCCSYVAIILFCCLCMTCGHMLSAHGLFFGTRADCLPLFSPSISFRLVSLLLFGLSRWRRRAILLGFCQVRPSSSLINRLSSVFWVWISSERRQIWCFAHILSLADSCWWYCGFSVAFVAMDSTCRLFDGCVVSRCWFR
jgi:hypothetical protein